MIVRRALLLIALTAVALVLSACYMKVTASRLANVYSTVWNESGTCYINSYIPQYSALGTPGKIFHFFTSEAFFRVYAKDGTLLKSSEWLIWQSEFTRDERALWVNGHAIYPTATGYEGWNIPVCG
ncbi:hypothetical protein J3D54_001753 [Pseudomonas sp. GGS8]|uniref:hypothetical protein n=1 Tax=Pseudomonas sp. GGS8 TaxID=2817892 RepID=UPI00209FD6BD|nr:hypothetical protein [Pseudomonas sp. GGS8]MCP1442621.1 hypothetical protein [Pseudomonas sp. GGS8]